MMTDGKLASWHASKGAREGRVALIALLLAILPACQLAAVQCPDGAPPPCTRPAAGPSPNSVAVLYFDSRGADSADAYLAEGLTEEIIGRLQQVRRLEVASRYASQRVRGQRESPAALGRQLRARYLVGGSIQRAAGRLVVRVELLRADREVGVWSERYDRSGDDLLALVDEIARAVATGVAGELLPAERTSLSRGPTRNNVAYRQYLLGNTLLGRRTELEVRRALAAYSQATHLDPGFVAAWARISLARNIQSAWASWDEGISRDSLRTLARVSAVRALALDSSSAEAWMAFGAVAYNAGELWAARDAYERSVALDSLNPEVWHFYGVLYGRDCGAGCLDDYQRAAPLLRRALALDPTLRNSWRLLGYVARDAGRLAEAEAATDSALALGPWGPALSLRGGIRFRRGNVAGALADLAEIERVDGVSQAVLRDLYMVGVGDSTSARLRLAGLRAQADSGQPNYLMIASFSTVLGLRSMALDALERLRATSSPSEPRCGPTLACSVNLLTWRVMQDPIFAPLYVDPRFQRLREETRPRVPWLSGAGGSNR